MAGLKILEMSTRRVLLIPAVIEPAMRRVVREERMLRKRADIKGSGISGIAEYQLSASICHFSWISEGPPLL